MCFLQRKEPKKQVIAFPKKKQVIAFPKSALSKGFSYLCKRNIFLINNPSINQQDHEKAIRTFCGMRSCRM